MTLEMIGNRIRFLRINKSNLSQEEFALLIGVDRTYLSRVESGKQNLTVEMLIKICEIGFNINLTEFFNFNKINF